MDELSAALSAEHVFGVELNDVAAEVVGTLFEDTVDRRLLCGAGTFNLHGRVALLRDTGFDGPWGVEILSESFRALPVREALELAAESTLTVLQPGAAEAPAGDALNVPARADLMPKCVPHG